MKARYLILFISFFLVTFNTLASGVLDAYDMSSCLFVDLSIVLSAGLIYYLFASSIADGYKISTLVILCFTGLFRLVCMGIMGTQTQNNVALLLASLLFLIEIAVLLVVSYLSKK